MQRLSRIANLNYGTDDIRFSMTSIIITANYPDLSNGCRRLGSPGA